VLFGEGSQDKSKEMHAVTIYIKNVLMLPLSSLGGRLTCKMRAHMSGVDNEAAAAGMPAPVDVPKSAPAKKLKLMQAKPKP